MVTITDDNYTLEIVPGVHIYFSVQDSKGEALVAKYIEWQDLDDFSMADEAEQQIKSLFKRLQKLLTVPNSQVLTSQQYLVLSHTIYAFMRQPDQFVTEF